MLKHKFFTILLMLTLISPVLAEEPQAQVPEALTSVSQETTESLVQKALNTTEKITFKQPVSKRKIAKKFLLAMAGVGISSILLFLILSLYNKVRESLGGSAKETPPEKITSLTTPDDLTEAVKTFLEKTKWDN